jgi:Flp pilus assembly protein TadG
MFIRGKNRGQAAVEFTLVFILLIIVTWIPADFGLAFYTGQLALNASRDGARIAAAERTLPALPASCTMPCSGAPDLLAQAAKRVSSALLPGATLTLSTENLGTCNTNVVMRVQGNYNFFFYRLLNFFGWGGQNTLNIDRISKMRWEHQC